MYKTSSVVQVLPLFLFFPDKTNSVYAPILTLYQGGGSYGWEVRDGVEMKLSLSVEYAA